MKALVLLSGGQDSTTCLYWAKRKYNNQVEAIGFYYGQKHAVEQEAAVKIAADAGVVLHLVNLENVFHNSALVDPTQDVSGQHSINKALPATFTAGRNVVFLSVAAGVAYNRRIQVLVTGVCETDYSGYPDCRATFVEAMENALCLGLGAPMKVDTPLMFLNKAEIWKLAKDLGVLEVIVRDTVTDYNGDMTHQEWGHGQENNPASVLRAKGFREAREKGWI